MFSDERFFFVRGEGKLSILSYFTIVNFAVN